MKPFQYATAQTTESAQDLVGKKGAYLAGGNDLLGLMKEYLVEPDILVDIKSLPGLNTIQPGAESWTIGANVTVAQIEDHTDLSKTFPALHQAATDVGSRQIRNVASLGGNLAQHSRCWYFRHRDVKCLKKWGTTCYARDGENQYHSLFTGNPCISPVVSNLSIALAALDARVIVQRASETLRWSIADLYAKAWDNPTAHNSLQNGDLILRVEIPTPGSGARSAYMQISQRADFDWALVSCAAAAQLDGTKITSARIYLGSIAPIPFTVPTALKYMEGKDLNADLAAQVARRLLADAEPLFQNAYKLPMAHTLIQRTLLQLIA
jgi:xanthine dehydrogenase YagS FAD-binding subunit